MLIQCPSCHCRAKIADDREGAKVKCGECGRLYVARVAASRYGAGGGKGPLVAVAAASVIVVLALVLIRSSSKGDAPASRAAIPAEAAPPAVERGWKAPLVRSMASLHEAVALRDRAKVASLLHGPRIWEREHLAADGSFDASVPTFLALSELERAQAVERWVTALVEGPERALVGDWAPFDGELVESTDDAAIVRLAVKQRPNGREQRWVEWRLAKEAGRFKAWSWERWLTPEEAAAEAKRLAKGYEVITRSDGTVVHERKPEPLGHLDDTPEELRARIDRAVATMLDLSLTVQSSRAQKELIEIGRPAIPRLLNQMYEIPADTEENRIRCNLLDQALKEITGRQFGYAPGAAGTGAGVTDELRDSAIKQWFAWWFKNEKTFVKRAEKPAGADDF